MKVLLTGASGYIGRFALRELLRRGHSVLATVRSAPPEEWSELANLEILRRDLLDITVEELSDRGVDCTVHLAAAVGGYADKQHRDTVLATDRLLTAMRAIGIRRLVGVSSIAVLDFLALPSMALVDEASAPASGDSPMGRYPRFKLQQERLFTGFGNEPGNGCVIIRPGLVYDDSWLSAAHAGIFAGPVCFLVLHPGEVPTVAAQGVAEAIAAAAELEVRGCEVVHLVDDRLPRQSEYIEALRRRRQLPLTRLALPSSALEAIFRCLRLVAGKVPGCPQPPELILPQSYAARLKPFRFSNAKARRLLGWRPGSGLQ